MKKKIAIKDRSRVKLLMHEETGDHYVFDALVLPYGGHKTDNTDCAGERFTPKTDFKVSDLRLPPVVYAHGYPMDAAGEADRTVVGDTLDRWFDAEGGWAKLGIRKGTPLTDEIMDAYKRGKLKFSSMAILARKAANGIDFDTWLPGEFTIVTDKTPVPSCNLLTRAGQYGKMALADIFDSSLSDEEAEVLKGYLKEEDGSSGSDIPLTDDNNPAGANGNQENLEDYGEEEKDDMTKEELDAAISGALAPMVTRIAALEKPVAPAAGEGGEGERGKTDGDLDSFVTDKVNRMKMDGAVNGNAAKLVDGYIGSGLIDPKNRLSQIKLFAAAIEGDGRKKVAGGALATLMEVVETGHKVTPDARLKGYGMNGHQGADDANQEDVNGMASAAFEDDPEWKKQKAAAK